MILSVDTYHWPGPIGYFFRSLAANAVATPFGNVVVFAVGIAVGRATKVHHKVRDFLLAPVHDRFDSHEEHWRKLHDNMDRLHAHLGVPEHE